MPQPTPGDRRRFEVFMWAALLVALALAAVAALLLAPSGP